MDLNINIVLNVENGHVKSAKKERAEKLPKEKVTKPPKEKAVKERKPAQPLKDPLDNYIPHGIVTYIGRQKCKCGCETEYVAGRLLRYSARDNVGGVRTIRTRAFAATDGRYTWDHLPRFVEYLDPESIDECPRCIEPFDPLLDIFALPQVPVQISLPFGG